MAVDYTTARDNGCSTRRQEQIHRNCHFNKWCCVLRRTEEWSKCQMAHEIEIVFRFQTIGLIKCNDGDIKKKDFQTIEILFNKMNTMKHLILSCFETVKDLKINKIHPAFVSNDTRRLISNWRNSTEKKPTVKNRDLLFPEKCFSIFPHCQ